MTQRPQRAEVFAYQGLEVEGTTLVAHYRLDALEFTERVDFEGLDGLDAAARAVASLWYLVAGLSYYKAGAAKLVDLGETPVGPAGRALLEASLHDGLGEFSVVNDLDLEDVTFVGGSRTKRESAALDPTRVLVPFGGGIDSLVSLESLNHELERTLFVVSPASGRFDALEATAALSGLEIVRATRSLDPNLLAGAAQMLRGHVPVTAMVTLLASVAAAASGRGGVVMSNEHSASVPNMTWHGRAINHQWSKSLAAEVLIANAIDEVLSSLDVASFLRERSEIWVAERFSQLREYHHVFRSCNRAFAQDPSRRASTWCGECDKCLFIDLVLAPFIPRDELAGIFGTEPLASAQRREQLEVLVGLGATPKPFECVGDPRESAAALAAVARDPAWADVVQLSEVRERLETPDSLESLLKPQGPSRVPAHWLR